MPPSFSRGSTVKLLVLILSVMFAYPAFGAAGDACATTSRTWMEGDCTILCDAHKSDGDCTGNPILVGFGRHRRIRSLAIELQVNTNCSSGDAKIYSRSTETGADGPWHLIGTIDLDAKDNTGISMIEIDGIAAAPLPYMKAVFSGEAGCSDSGATIVIHRRGAIEND